VVADISKTVHLFEVRTSCAPPRGGSSFPRVHPASGSVHCCKVPCRTLRSISKLEIRPVFWGLHCVRKPRGTWVDMGVHGKAHRGCGSHLWLARRAGLLGLTTTGASHTHPHMCHRAHTPNPPQHNRFTPRCISVVLWTPCSGVEWCVSKPALKGSSCRFGKRHDANRPANLAVEGAEERLSILPDYTPTRPCALDHLVETCNVLSCSRTATVVCMVSGVH
jgi:hypothetical protein